MAAQPPVAGGLCQPVSRGAGAMATACERPKSAAAAQPRLRDLKSNAASFASGSPPG